MKTPGDGSRVIPMDMTDNSHLQQRVIFGVNQYLELACSHHDQHFKATDIRFDLSGTAAGCCVIKRRQTVLRFNPVLLAENTEEFLLRTVPHEVAHLVAYQLYGKNIKPHGSEWKTLMALFGADDKR